MYIDWRDLIQDNEVVI